MHCIGYEWLVSVVFVSYLHCFLFKPFHYLFSIIFAYIVCQHGMKCIMHIAHSCAKVEKSRTKMRLLWWLTLLLQLLEMSISAYVIKVIVLPSCPFAGMWTQLISFRGIYWFCSSTSNQTLVQKILVTTPYSLTPPMEYLRLMSILWTAWKLLSLWTGKFHQLHLVCFYFKWFLKEWILSL